jgi:hypothetical protein
MDPNVLELSKVIVSAIVVSIPLMGLTIRFALKPIADAMVRIRESRHADENVAFLERRVALLEKELEHQQSLREEIHRLAEAQEFQSQLLAAQVEVPAGAIRLPERPRA